MGSRDAASDAVGFCEGIFELRAVISRAAVHFVRGSGGRAESAPHDRGGFGRTRGFLRDRRSTRQSLRAIRHQGRRTAPSGDARDESLGGRRRVLAGVGFPLRLRGLDHLADFDGCVARDRDSHAEIIAWHRTGTMPDMKLNRLNINTVNWVLCLFSDAVMFLVMIGFFESHRSICSSIWWRRELSSYSLRHRPSCRTINR